MKKLFLLLALVGCTVFTQAQDFMALQEIELKAKSDYVDNEATVLQCAEFLLNNNITHEPNNRTRAVAFIMRWMTGCEITFEIGEDFMDFTDGNDDRTSVYMASLVFAALKGPDAPENAKAINTKAKDVFIDYCANHSDLKRNKAIKNELKKRK